MKGTLLIDKPIQINSNRTVTIALPFSEYPSGFYIVRVKQESYLYIKSFIKQ